ncbi:hypothetical protein [uncultured Nonlabens sp.]|jgi:hypothetical protein|uniref:hypothetical protein n=1 Tax=uncultured Nonlabens sp. TaxID=859306 RepID=UPI0030DB0745|tara:strand:+ start:4175 stop:4654 length:480 start_codon:yes stop_codon:yes gene_type:complete
MKKLIYLTGILIVGISLYSFTLKKEECIDESLDLLIEINLADYQEGKWGSWNLTDCLRGLDFRVRNDGYNKYAKKTRWSVEFRNRYEENIHFSTKMVAYRDRAEIKRSEKTTDRIHVDGRNGTNGSYFLVDDPNSVYVYINRIRISPKDYNSDYVDCDR